MGTKVLESELEKFDRRMEAMITRALAERDREFKLEIAALKAQIDQLRGPSWVGRR